MAASGDSHASASGYLLPTAPQALVDAVRKYLARSDVSDLPLAAQTPNGRSSNSHDLFVHRSPWQLLHVERSAPQGIVDIAYRIWRESRVGCEIRQAPLMPPGAAQVVPATVAQAPEQYTNANGRAEEMSVPAMVPRPSSNGASDAPAVIENLSGDYRLGIGAGALRIGVGPACDVVVRDDKRNTEVRIWPHGEGYMLRVATGSVRVNGAPADWVVLDDGDILEIGDAAFRFRRQPH